MRFDNKHQTESLFLHRTCALLKQSTVLNHALYLLPLMSHQVFRGFCETK